MIVSRLPMLLLPILLLCASCRTEHELPQCDAKATLWHLDRVMDYYTERVAVSGYKITVLIGPEEKLHEFEFAIIWTDRAKGLFKLDNVKK